VGERAALRRRLDEREAQEAIVLLAALGVVAEIEDDDLGGLAVLVADADRARAEEILAEAESEAAIAGEAGTRGGDGGIAGDFGELPAGGAPGDGSEGLAKSWRWLGPGSAAIAAVFIVCTAAFLWTTRGALEASYGRMLECGAITTARVDRGEVWRLASAVFLHFDLAHLVANLGTLLLVGPLLARVLGPLRFLAVFVGAGVAGNLASYLLAPSAALKAGASGGVAGVIGALAGQALREGRSGRFRRWQIAGAVLAAYALLVGAGAGRDHIAHLGGLLAGVALGSLLAPRASRPPERGGGALAADVPPA
jgi:membrane associated rhomboid family serine protease